MQGDFKKICKEINSQIQPRQEFLDNLYENVSRKIEEDNNKMSKKTYLPKVAVAFLTLGIVSTSVFGKDIGNFMSRMFSNVDKGLQMATENGYIQEVNSEYVTDQGIAIKIDNIIVDENILNITFDVIVEDCEDVYFNELKLNDEYNNIIYPSTELVDNVKHNISRKHSKKSISKNNIVVTETFYDIENNFSEYKNLYLEIYELGVFDLNDNEKTIKGNWNFEINIDNSILKRNRQKYIIEENNLVENYDIELNNTGFNVELWLYDNIENLRKEDIILEDENGKKYICSDFYMIGTKEINIIFSVTNYDNINELYLKIKDMNLKLIKNNKIQ